MEGMAADLVPSPDGLPRGGAWLFVETGGETPGEARARAEAIVRAADVVDARVVTDPAGQRTLWRIREDASGTATRMPDGSEAWPGWEDCAVPPARLGAYLRDFRGLLDSYGLRGTPYGHFGDGCIHVRIDFDLLTAPGIAVFRRFSEELADLVVAHGGSLSGEHGDGQARAELLPRMYGAQTVELFERAKAVWDPDDLLNPGILVRPAPLDANLRFAPLPRRPVDVAFGYPADGGDFSAAVRRCVGVAKCRTASVSGPAVMCPSYRATGEEEHSTRGRARLLHEMLAGELVTDGWRSTEVRDALDLCLSCKGCRSDCPVEVDMATYKAEFLHHHYAGRRRPAAHYALGRLPRWLRAVSRTRTAPLVNALARLRPLAWAARRLGGIAPEREIPRLAARTFTRWWERQRGTAAEGTGPLVVLWPDTFTEHLSPSVGQAAVRVLRAAGLRVALPPTVHLAKAPVGDGLSVALDPVSLLRGRGRVCCGLTYVSTGQLDQARTVMRRTLDLMEPVLDTDAPVVVLEPSCAAALRTDLPELLHDDPRAARLAAKVLTFAEALERHAPTGPRPPWTARSPARPTATSTRSSATPPTAGCAPPRASPATWRAAAAASPATSASRRATTRSRSPAPRTSSSRPSARPRPGRSSWRTATPAGRSWNNWPGYGDATWRRYWRRRWTRGDRARSVQPVQSPSPALGHPQRVGEGVGQALGEVAEFALRSAREQTAGVGEEFGAHGQLRGLGGVGEPGDGAAGVVGDQVAGLALRAGPGQQTRFARRAHAASPHARAGRRRGTGARPPSRRRPGRSAGRRGCGAAGAGDAGRWRKGRRGAVVRARTGATVRAPGATKTPTHAVTRRIRSVMSSVPFYLRLVTTPRTAATVAGV